MGEVADVTVSRGVDKLADVIVLASVPFACDMVAVLSAAMVGTVISFRLKGQTPAFRNPAIAFAGVIEFVQALCRSSEN